MKDQDIETDELKIQSEIESIMEKVEDILKKIEEAYPEKPKSSGENESK